MYTWCQAAVSYRLDLTNSYVLLNTIWLFLYFKPVKEHTIAVFLFLHHGVSTLSQRQLESLRYRQFLKDLSTLVTLALLQHVMAFFLLAVLVIFRIYVPHFSALLRS